MKPDAQHIALMESLGWKVIPQTEKDPASLWPEEVEVYTSKTGHMMPPNGTMARIPPPLSLDILHQAEATLTEDESIRYPYRLAEAIVGGGPDVNAILKVAIHRLIRATKEQRLEAYLRVKGLWVGA